MERNLVFLLVLLFVAIAPSSSQVELKTLKPKDMKKDFEAFMTCLDAHPDPFTNVEAAKFKDLVTSVKSDLNSEKDEIDFYKDLAMIIASIKDGHSRMLMPKDWLEDKQKDYGVFPYEVYLTNDNILYATKAYGNDESIPLGAEILEIEGMTVAQFIDGVDPYISYETVAFRNDQITRSFSMMLYLMFKKTDGLRFKFKHASEAEVVVKNLDQKAYKKEKKDQRDNRDKQLTKGKPYDFEVIKPGIGKLDIYSFSANKDKYEFFLNKTFKKIRNENVHSLIIDVRGNYGGWPKIASLLFHYIHDGHFKTMAKSSMKVSKPYREYFTGGNPRIKNAFNQVDYKPERLHYVDIRALVLNDLDTYVQEAAFFNEPPRKEDFEFSGDCYLLIDRKSYSAASSFASSFQCYTMGYIIGEETGGTKIFRANAMGKKLPKSKFGVNVSTTKLFTTCFDQEGQGVTPNVEVVPTVLDLVHGVDTGLITALRLIKKVQKEKAAAEH